MDVLLELTHLNIRDNVIEYVILNLLKNPFWCVSLEKLAGNDRFIFDSFITIFIWLKNTNIFENTKRRKAHVLYQLFLGFVANFASDCIILTRYKFDRKGLNYIIVPIATN
jgi:hypothetical protein